MFKEESARLVDETVASAAARILVNTPALRIARVRAVRIRFRSEWAR